MLSDNNNNRFNEELHLHFESNKEEIAEARNEVARLEQELEDSEWRAASLREELSSAREEIALWVGEVDKLSKSTGFADMKANIDRFRETALESFREVEAFLKTVNLDDDAFKGGEKVKEILDAVKNGSLTAGQAITKIKTSFSDLIATASKSGGLFDTQQIQAMFAQLDRIESKLSNITKDTVSALQNGAKASGEMAQTGSNVTGVVSGAAEAIAKLGASADGSYEPVIQLVEALAKFSNEVDQTKLIGIANTFSSIANIAQGSFGEKSASGLINLLQRLEKFSNDNGGFIRFNISGFEKLNELKVSKASLNNLATFLPQITAVDISKLQSLASIDWTNLNNLKVTKSSVDGLVQVANVSGQIKELKEQVDALAKSEREAAEAAKNNPLLNGGANNSRGVAGGYKPQRGGGGNNSPDGGDWELAERRTAYKAATDEATNSTERFVHSLTNEVGTLKYAEDENGKLALKKIEVKQSFDTAAQAAERVAKAEKEAAQSAQNYAKNEGSVIDKLNKVNDARNKLAKAGGEESGKYRSLDGELKQIASAYEAVFEKFDKSDHGEKAQRTFNLELQKTDNLLKSLNVDVDAYSNNQAEVAEAARKVADAEKAAAEAAKESATNRQKSVIDYRKFLIDTGETQKKLYDTGGAGAPKYEEYDASLKKYIQDVKELFSVFNQSKGTKDDYNKLKLGLRDLGVEYGKLKKDVSEYYKEQTKVNRNNDQSAMNEKQKQAALYETGRTLNSLQRSLDNSTAAEHSRNEESRNARAGLIGEYQALTELKNRVEQGTISQEQYRQAVKASKISIDEYTLTLKRNGDLTKSWSDRISGLAQKFTMWFGTSQLIMKAVQAMRQAVKASIELDDSMTQLKIVTNETDSTYAKFAEDISSTAQKLGASITDLIDATTTYARLGYNLDESKVLSSLTAQLQNVGDIEAQDAQDAITAIIKAFDDIDTSNLENAMDKLVMVGNNTPISVAQIAEGMNNASSALSAAGNSFDQSVALLTAANTTIQNAARSSTGLRTIAARIRNTKTELEDLGEEVLSEAKYGELVSSLTEKGVQITDALGNYRSTYDIISQIAAVWKDMESSQQAALAQTLAGTRQQDVFYSLINQFQEASKAMDLMSDSAGALSESNNEYLESITAHIKSFKSAFTELGSDLFTGDLLKTFIDLGRYILIAVDGLVKFINIFGGLKPLLITVGGLVAAIKLDSIISLFTSLKAKILDLASPIINVFSRIPAVFQSFNSGTAVAVQGTTRLQAALNGLGITASAAQIAIASVTAVIAIAITAYSKWKQKREEAWQSALHAAEMADEEVNKIRDTYEAYESARDSYSSNAGSKEELESATLSLMEALGIEETEIDTLIKKYGDLDAALKQVSRDKIEDYIHELREGYNAAKEEFLDVMKSGAVISESEDVFAQKLIGAGFKYNQGNVADPLFFNFKVEGLDSALDAYDTLISMRDALEEGAEEGLYTLPELQDSTIYQQIINNITAVRDEYNALKDNIDQTNSAQLQLDLDGWLENAVDPQSAQDIDALVQSIVNAAEASGLYMGSTEDIRKSIESALSNMPEYSKWFTFIGDAAAEAADKVSDSKIGFSDLFSGSDKESEKTSFEEYVEEYIKKREKIKEAIGLVENDLFDPASFPDLVRMFPQLNGHLDDLLPALYAVQNQLIGTEGAAGFLEKTLGKLATDEDRAQLESYWNSLEMGIDGYSDTFKKLMMGEDGKGSAFKEEVDEYLDQMDLLNNALDELAQGKNADEVLKSLIDTFPELASRGGDLEEAIRSMIDTITGSNGEGGATGIFKTFEDAISKVASPEDRERLRQYLDLVLRLSGAQGGFEYTNKKVSNFTSVLGTMRNAINSQGTGKVVSPEDYRTLQDYSSALEFYNGSLRYNVDMVNKITDAKAKEQKAIIKANKAQDQSQYLKNAAQIERLRKSLKEKTNLTKSEIAAINQDIASLLSQNKSLMQNSKQYDLLADSIDQATSAYQRWLDSKGQEKPGTMFSEAAEALNQIDKVINYRPPELTKAGKIKAGEKDYLEWGNYGDPTYKAALEFLIPESIDRDDTEAINSYLQSIGKYFSYDQEGEYIGMNIEEFCQDAMKAGLMQISKDGKSYEIAGKKTMQEFVDGMGLSLPLLQAMFDYMELKGADFEFSRDAGTASLADLNVEANEAAEALRNLDKYGDLDLVINVADFADKNRAIETLNKNISTMKEFKDISINPDVDTEELEYANAIIEYSVRQKQELSKPLVMKVDTESVQGDLGILLGLLVDFQETANEIELKTELGEDTSESVAQLNQIIADIQATDPEVFAKLGIKWDGDASLSSEDAAAAIQSAIDSIDAEAMIQAGVDPSLIEDYEPPEKEMNVQVNILDSAVRNYSVPTKYGTAKYYVDDSAVRSYSPPNLFSTLFYGRNGADGTAHASGTWGTSKRERALVGELGAEIIVDPKTGKWYTVGDSGAEFATIPKGAIIFNHKQTKALLENGHIFDRGKSFASGTAHANYSDTVTGGMLIGRTKTAPNVNTYKEVYNAVYDATSDAYSDSSGSYDSGGGSEEKTAFERFQEWFSTLFDWIEVKLEHQTDKISRYIKKAENAMDSGNYSSAASNYVNAIDSTSTLIESNEKASQAYLNRANEVLQRAYRAGTINAPGIETIKYLAREGAYDYSDYNDQINEVIQNYKEMYDKAMECANAVDELHSNMKQYVDDLKNMRDAQRDARTDLIDQKLSIADSFIEVNTGNAGYNTMTRWKLGYRDAKLDEINSAYLAVADGMSSDVNSLGSKAKSRISSQAASTKNTAYKKALNNASNAISKQVPVSSSDLSVIAKYSSPTYESLLAYNQGVSLLETARMEYAVEYAANNSELYSNVAEIYNAYDDASNNTIDLLRQKAENSSYSAATKNSNLQKIASSYNEILSNDSAEITYFQNEINKRVSTINSSSFKGTSYGALSAAGQKSVNGEITNARNAVKKDQLISLANLQNIATYVSKGYISPAFYTACVAYNNAWNSRQQARWQNEIDQQTIANEKAALAAQMVSNTETEYDNQLKSIQATTTSIQTAQKLKSTRGAILDKSDYQNLINQSKKEQSIYEAEAKAIKNVIDSALKSGLWSTASQEYKDAMLSYQGYINSAKECTIAQEEWNNAIVNLPIEKIERQLSLLDAQMDIYKSIQSYNEAKWIDSTEEEYEKMLTNLNKRVDQLKQERDYLYDNYVAARDSGAGSAYGGKDYLEWAKLYDDSLTALNNAYKEIEGIRDELRDDVYWRTFDRAHESAKRLKTILSDIGNLIDDSMSFDSNGNLTNYGAANIANLVKQYELAREEVQNYSNDIANLNSLYAGGWYAEREYQEKLNEIQDSLLKAASEVKSVTDSIVDMYKSMAQAELDSLFELIDARSEALDKKKEYYEYDKTIREKTKDVMALQAQLAALNGVAGAEARAKKAQLQADLAEAQGELDDTVREHIFDLSKTALSDLKTTLQEAFNDKWDNLGQNLEEIVELISAANTLAESSSRATYATLKQLLAHYGIDATATGVDKHFASGTAGAPRKLRALVGEDGSEIITTKSGLILTLNKGDGVIPAQMTKNLMAMAAGGIAMPTVGSIKAGNTTINQHYDSLINIEGSADAATVEDLKRFSKDILEQSYNYTSQKIYNGYIKAGGKRVV